MIVKGLTVGLLQENCYIFACSRTRKGVIIDPGDNARAILRVVDQQALKIEKIINTHAHFDHVMAVPAVKPARGPRSIFIAPTCRYCMICPNGCGCGWIWMWIPSLTLTVIWNMARLSMWAKRSSRCALRLAIHPAMWCLSTMPATRCLAAIHLFQGSIGRFDLPGADGPTLFRSIREQLLTLPDDYTVYPGHGQLRRSA